MWKAVRFVDEKIWTSLSAEYQRRWTLCVEIRNRVLWYIFRREERSSNVEEFDAGATLRLYVELSRIYMRGGVQVS